jgi:hypothetical protein
MPYIIRYHLENFVLKTPFVYEEIKTNYVKG